MHSSSFYWLHSFIHSRGQQCSNFCYANDKVVLVAAVFLLFDADGAKSPPSDLESLKLRSPWSIGQGTYADLYIYICSSQSRNLRNLEITLRILRIPKLRTNLEIVQPIWRLCNMIEQSRDCAIHLCNLKTVQAQLVSVMD